MSKSSVTVTNAEQRRRDWSIVRRLAVHIWPKDDWATRGRVVLGVGLLVCGKVRRL
jgi:ABC transporter ATM